MYMVYIHVFWLLFVFSLYRCITCSVFSHSADRLLIKFSCASSTGLCASWHFSSKRNDNVEDVDKNDVHRRLIQTRSTRRLTWLKFRPLCPHNSHVFVLDSGLCKDQATYLGSPTATEVRQLVRHALRCVQTTAIRTRHSEKPGCRRSYKFCHLNAKKWV